MYLYACVYKYAQQYLHTTAYISKYIYMLLLWQDSANIWKIKK